MVDATALGDRIEERSDLGKGEPGEWAYWNSQEAIALKAETPWRYRSRAIVRRYRDDRGDDSGGINAVSNQLHRFNILWSNVQTLIPTLYGRTPKPDIERRFKDQDDTGRLASMLLERCLSYSMNEYGFDAAMKAVVQDRLLPGRGVARVMYIPHFGEPIADDKQFEEQEDEASIVSNPGDTGQKDEGQQGNPGPNVPGTAQPEERLREVVWEECTPNYIFWEDYLEAPARQWKEVPWVRYRSYMTRPELVARFGSKIGKLINLDYTPKGYRESDSDRTQPPPDLFKKAVIHETWDKVEGQVVWWAPGTPDVIADKTDDPLGLTDFYPNPDPLLSTTTNDKRIPVPDYIEYQDQARELDTLTARIDRLTRALKVSGVYAGSEKQVLQQLVDEGTENRLIPVEDWAQFAGDKGGLANVIQWVPIQQIAETLIQLYNARDRQKQILYEITGMADIIRGSSDPSETATAQGIKANFATLRIQPQQRDVARFARDMIRLMASVIMQQFSEKTISMITGYPQLAPVPQLPPRPNPPLMLAPPSQAPQQGPSQVSGPQGAQEAQQPPPNPALQQFQQQMQAWQQTQQQVQAITQQNEQKKQQFAAAVKLLRDDAENGFRIDIEADSTISPDEQAEKASRIEFLQQFVPLLEQVVPIAQGNPPMAALAREITLFAMRGFRVSRSLEETMEKAFDAIAQMPPNPKVAGEGKGQQSASTDPMAIQAKVHDTEVQAQTDRMRIAATSQQTQQKLALQTEELEQEGRLRTAQLVFDAHKLEEQNRHRDLRDLNVSARGAQGLT